MVFKYLTIREREGERESMAILKAVNCTLYNVHCTCSKILEHRCILCVCMRFI